MRPSVSRTRYFVYPKFQLALVFANALAWLAFVAITLVVVTVSGREMDELGRAAGFTADHVYFQFLRVQRQTLIANVVLGALVALVASSVFLVWFSHRLVGPLFNLQRYLANFKTARARGETPPPLRFRKNDLFREIADDLNAALSER